MPRSGDTENTKIQRKKEGGRSGGRQRRMQRTGEDAEDRGGCRGQREDAEYRVGCRVQGRMQSTGEDAEDRGECRGQGMMQSSGEDAEDRGWCRVHGRMQSTGEDTEYKGGCRVQRGDADDRRECRGQNLHLWWVLTLIYCTLIAGIKRMGASTFDDDQWSTPDGFLIY
jgi:hypothetical protein